MLWAEDAPTHCPNGHRLGPNRVLVGWLAPRAGTLPHPRVPRVRSSHTVGTDMQLEVTGAA